MTPKVPHGEYGMAVNKGMNADLLAAINDGLNKMLFVCFSTSTVFSMSNLSEEDPT